MCDLKEHHGILCIGIEDITGKKFVANPDKEYKLNKDDRLIVIASERPEI